MKEEFAIADEWLPFEIHPDTPPQGVRWADYFPGMQPARFFQELDAKGKPMGVRFGPQPLMSNSRQAMEAGEFAKEHGAFEAFHEAVFKAFFTDCLDIGNRQVLLNIASNISLDVDALNEALAAGTYLPILKQTTEQAHGLQVRAAPTFVIKGFGILTGAQPLATFQAALRQAAQSAGNTPQNM